MKYISHCIKQSQVTKKKVISISNFPKISLILLLSMNVTDEVPMKTLLGEIF